MPDLMAAPSGAPLAVAGNSPVDFDPWKRNRVAEKKVNRENFWERMGDAYISLLAAAIAVAYAAGIAHAFSASLRVGAQNGVIRNGIGVVPGESAASALVLLGLLAALSLISRLGPVAVDRAQGFWWLSLPVDRTPFLSRLLRHRLVTTCLYGMLLWLPIGYGTVLGGLSQGNFAGALLGAFSLGLIFVLLSLLAALAQTRGWARHFRTAVNAAYLSVVIAYGADVLLRLTGDRIHGRILGGAAIHHSRDGAGGCMVDPGDPVGPGRCGIQGAAGAPATHSRPGTGFPGCSQRACGCRAGTVGRQIAVGRDRPGGCRRNPPKRCTAGAHAPARGRRVFTHASGIPGARPLFGAHPGRGPGLVACTKVWCGLLAGWGIPMAGIFAVDGGHPLVLGTLVIVGSCVAAKAASTAAAQAADVPSLESIIPLGRGAMRQTHAAVAAMLLVPWGIGLAGMLAWPVSADAASLPMLLVLGALAGAGLAAGAVRLAYRPPLDWGSVMLLAALGQATGPMIQHFTYGYDVMVVAVIALVAGFILNPLPPTLLAIAAVVAAIAWGIGTSVSVNSKAHGIDGRAP